MPVEIKELVIQTRLPEEGNASGSAGAIDTNQLEQMIRQIIQEELRLNGEAHLRNFQDETIRLCIREFREEQHQQHLR